MDIKNLFRVFKRRLMVEAMIKSLLFSLLLGAGTVFLMSLAYHIAAKNTPWLLALAVFGCVFAIAFIVGTFVVLYPTHKRIAVRIDETGLQERACTMLEFRDDQSEIARLQREDALKHIKSVSPKQIKSRLRKREFISCAAVVCAALTILLIPHDLLATPLSAEELKEKTQQEIVRELLDALRDEVMAEKMPQDIQDEVNEIIEELQEDLENAQSELERAAAMEDAREQLEALLEEAITKDEIGQALKENELTTELGEAIEQGDPERVSEALEKLEEQLKENDELIPELSEALKEALEKSEVKEDDSLYQAIDEFAKNLEETANEVDPEKREEKLTESFDEAEESINAALEEQQQLEEQLENIDEMLEEAKEEVLNPDKASVPFDVQDQMEQILNEYREDLEQAESKEEQDQLTEEAIEELEAMLEEEITKDEIGDALMRYELTKELGNAIKRVNPDLVTRAIDRLETKLTEDHSLVFELATTISRAMGESNISDEDPLNAALKSFSTDMRKINKDQNFKELPAAMDRAEAAIIEALLEQEAMEEELEKVEETVEQVKAEVIGEESEEPANEPGEPGEEQNQSQEGEEPADNQNPEGLPGQNGQPMPGDEGGDEGSMFGNENDMTEGMYDPVMGSVGYGEVYAAYYIEYLLSLEEGEIPLSLQELLDQYFSSLN
ncbi:MAG: hypothetical protein IJC50_03570 [Clostridia bacterium]|nr:hypothetical protein [Clostridia bacterium]